MCVEILDAIKRFPWLKEILHEFSREQLAQIKLRRFKPNDMMLEHCGTNYYTFILLSGVCCTCQNLENGVRFVLRKATVGDVVGFAGIYHETLETPAQIVARTSVTAAVLPQPLVQECFGKYPDFSMQISQRVIKRLQSLVNLFSECNNYPSYLGLVTYLEYNYRFYAKSYPAHYDGQVRIVESQKNIADFLGVDIRSVQRLLARMKEEGLVSVSSRNLYIDQAQHRALQELRCNWFLQDH